MFLARRCPICEEISDVPCAGCVAGLEPAAYLECAAEFELGCRALFAYTEVSSRLVLTLKYQRDMKLVRWLAPQLAGLMAGVLRGQKTELGTRMEGTGRTRARSWRNADTRLIPKEQPHRAQTICATWIPAAAKNRRRRGYDQAELLARAVAQVADLPCRKLLKRARDLPQGDRDLKGRLLGPSLAPAGNLLASGSLSIPKSVLIVDDVVTTGSSLRRAAATLRQAGIPRIGAIAVASRAKIPS